MSNQSLLNRIPENQNLIQPTKYQFVIPTLPFLNYFVQAVTLPGAATSSVRIDTPFSATWRHGDTLEYGELSLSTLIDEDMRVWEESLNWLISLTSPENFSQYARFKNPNGSLYHDALLTIENNNNLPNLRMNFRELHPTSIGSINFSVSDSAETAIVCDIQFRYDRFDITRS